MSNPSTKNDVKKSNQQKKRKQPSKSHGKRRASLPSKKKPKKERIPLRVTISFDVGEGWHGTKNRDFPGRHFSNTETLLLREWSNEFREGVPCTLEKPDTRTVKLPKTQKKRRKPFVGALVVRRQDAYQWYRATQRRLVDAEMDNNSVSREKKVVAAAAAATNKKATSTSCDQNGTGICKYSIETLTPSSFDSTGNKASEFIDIKWQQGTIDSLQNEKNIPYRIVLQTQDNINVPVYLMKGGRGSFLCASVLPPGKHIFPGRVTFTVLASKPSTEKQRSKKSKRTGSSTTNPTTTTNNDDETDKDSEDEESEEEESEEVESEEEEREIKERKNQRGGFQVQVGRNSPPCELASSQSGSSSSPFQQPQDLFVLPPPPPLVYPPISSSSSASSSSFPSSSFFFSSSSSSSSSVVSSSNYTPMLTPQSQQTPVTPDPARKHIAHSVSPQMVVLGGETRYVQIKWKEALDEPPRFINIGSTRVELFPVANGDCVFRIDSLQTGVYKIDGVSFCVYDPPLPQSLQNDSTRSNSSEGSKSP